MATQQGALGLVAAAAILGSGCGHTGTGPSPVGMTIVCPAPQTAQSPDGGPVTMTYSPPAVTGGVFPILTTCSPASGAPFAVGATNVTCTARDAQQQAA